jgi:hypothetical protein
MLSMEVGTLLSTALISRSIPAPMEAWSPAVRTAIENDGRVSWVRGRNTTGVSSQFIS